MGKPFSLVAFINIEDILLEYPALICPCHI